MENGPWVDQEYNGRKTLKQTCEFQTAIVRLTLMQTVKSAKTHLGL